MSDPQFLRMDELSGAPLYDLIVSALAPRPVGLIGTRDALGHESFAPYSFLMPGGFRPPSLAFSPMLDSSGDEKGTLRNVQDSGEFTVHVMDRGMAERLNSSRWGTGISADELRALGVRVEPGVAVASPRLVDVLACFECRVFAMVGHGKGAGAAVYVIGEVVAAHVWPKGDGTYGPMYPIGRLGGAEYLDCLRPERFTLQPRGE